MNLLKMTVLLWIVINGVSVAEGQSNKSRVLLEKKQATYTRTMAHLEKELGDDLNRAIASARKKGETARLNLLLDQQDKFKRKRVLPSGINIRPHIRSVIKAKNEMEFAYRTAMKKLTRQSNDSEASKVRDDMHKFRLEAKFMNGKQYAFGGYGLSWTQAQKLCRAQGGNLVAIESQAEQDFLLALLRDKEIDDAYIGAVDRQKKGRWNWVNGKKIDFSNWAPGEPNGSGRTFKKKYAEHHSTISRKENGFWGDINGSIVYDNIGFICQWE